MARRGRAPRKRSRKQRLHLSAKDFRYPGENGLYWQGVGGVMILYAWLAAVVFFVIRTPSGTPRYDLVAETLAWPFISVLICNLLSIRPRMREFKQRDQQSRVMSTNHPQWYKALQEFQRLCGLKRPPDMYLLPEERPFIFTMPAKGGTIVASRGIVEQLKPAEFVALMAHEMGHIIARHTRMELAIIFIRGANPVWKLILLPVTLMAVFMRGWIDAIDYTADRCAYLLTGGQARLVNAAIVKQALAMTPDADVTMEELDEFLTRPGDVEQDQRLLEQQIRISRFIGNVPNLRDRIEALGEFAKSEQAQQLLERLSQLRGASTLGA